MSSGTENAGKLPLIALLLLLTAFVPQTDIGRRGTEAKVRADVEGAVGALGERLPPLSLETLDGRPLALADFRGHPLLVTFERSVDW